MSEIRVVLADDHPGGPRRGPAACSLGSMARNRGGRASAADGREAVREVVLQRPDGGSARPPDARPGRLRRYSPRSPASAPEVAVLVLTMFDDDDSVFAAMRAGARGYVVTGAEQEEIGRAIRAVASGEAHLRT